MITVCALLVLSVAGCVLLSRAPRHGLREIVGGTLAVAPLMVLLFLAVAPLS